jgi:hypothetical protein
VLSSKAVYICSNSFNHLICGVDPLEDNVLQCCEVFGDGASGNFFLLPNLELLDCSPELGNGRP